MLTYIDQQKNSDPTEEKKKKKIQNFGTIQS